MNMAATQCFPSMRSESAQARRTSMAPMQCPNSAGSLAARGPLESTPHQTLANIMTRCYEYVLRMGLKGTSPQELNSLLNQNGYGAPVRPATLPFIFFIQGRACGRAAWRLHSISPASMLLYRSLVNPAIHYARYLHAAV